MQKTNKLQLNEIVALAHIWLHSFLVCIDSKIRQRQGNSRSDWTTWTSPPLSVQASHCGRCLLVEDAHPTWCSVKTTCLIWHHVELHTGRVICHWLISVKSASKKNSPRLFLGFCKNLAGTAKSLSRDRSSQFHSWKRDYSELLITWQRKLRLRPMLVGPFQIWIDRAEVAG